MNTYTIFQAVIKQRDNWNEITGQFRPYFVKESYKIFQAVLTEKEASNCILPHTVQPVGEVFETTSLYLANEKASQYSAKNNTQIHKAELY